MTTQDKSIFSRLLAAIKSLFKTTPRNTEFSAATINDTAHPLANMSRDEFEQLVYAIFRQRGYSVSEKHLGAYDGVDLVLHRDNELTYVQCKKWKEPEVDINDVGELYVAMESGGVKFGIVISSGVFTSEAIDFSLGKALLLINGADLSLMTEALNKSSEAKSAQEKAGTAVVTPAQEMPELEPLCPICSSRMVKRVARKGKNAGNTFWGCSKFPGCRGVVSI